MTLQAYYLRNETTGLFARHDSKGEHDNLTTDNMLEAKGFVTWSDASDYSQNYGAEWNVYST